MDIPPYYYSAEFFHTTILPSLLKRSTRSECVTFFTSVVGSYVHDSFLSGTPFKMRKEDLDRIVSVVFLVRNVSTISTYSVKRNRGSTTSSSLSFFFKLNSGVRVK